MSLIVHMLKYFSSMGADSSFEKNRLLLTGKNLQAPEQHTIKKILQTFQGEDDETRSEIAFATIVKKISTSDSNDNWMYLIKNLIIFDRAISEQCFAQEIAELNLPLLDQYAERNSRYAPLRTDQIVRNYWKLIKTTARLLKNKKHISYFPRSQRSQFLSTLSPAETMQQMESLNEYFSTTFVLINSITSTRDLPEATVKAITALRKSGLISFLLLQVLYKLIAYYSSQMLCANSIVAVMAKDVNMELLAVEEVKKFRQLLTKFKQDSSQIIEFVDKNKDIKGFEVINYRELDPMPDNSILKSIDAYIAERLSREEESFNVHAFVSDSKVRLQVRHKPRLSGGQAHHQTRKPIEAKRSHINNNPFQNFISSFSEDFPPKEVMTVDLIIAIREEKQREKLSERGTIYEENICYDERETCVVNHRDSLPEHIQFNKPILDDSETDRIVSSYSNLPTIWNFE